ncbi:hypothetical protein [Streptomyces sp. NPDC052535]|uniref:hypothetical protein n=1 Tax=Streptomyces sp. NPDC052535 TaxID=3155531 RepID=UPI00342DF186
MANSRSNPPYETLACGRRCHPDRYVVFTTRTWWGRKRWGVHDNHMGVNLTRLYTDLEAAEDWRVRLAMMEHRERQHSDWLARRQGQGQSSTW